MKILSTAVFTGPNVFAPIPVIYLQLDLGGLEAWPSGKLGPGFAMALLDLLPGLKKHGGKGADFAARLAGKGTEKDGLPLALLLGHMAAELERQTSALELPRGVLLRGEGKRQELFLGYEDADIAQDSAPLARQLLLALLPAKAKRGLKETPPPDFDPAAALRDFQASVADKALDPSTKLLLRGAARRGIPWQRMTPGRPRVVLGQGRYRRTIQGLLNDRTPATSALATADKSTVLQLLHDLGLPVPGTDGKPIGAVTARQSYRLLLIGGKMVSALRLRGDSEDRGVAPRAVTPQVHSSVRRMAERAAAVLRLEEAGLSYLATDIAQPVEQAEGAFTDIEAAPSLAPHDAAAPKRDLPGKVIEDLFPRAGSAGSRGRIPLAAVTGTNGKTTTVRMLARILTVHGLTTGFTTTDGAYVGTDLVRAGDVAGPPGAQAVLADPRVEAAVLETARGGILKKGLPFDRCDVAAITNITGDHLGIDGIENLEQLARVKQTVTGAARGRIVLNADDSRCVEIAGRSDSARLCYVTLQQDNAAVSEHLRGGGDAVVLGPEKRGGLIVLIEQGKASPLMAPKEIPATLEGAAWHNVQNAMFAAALARGLGVPAETISKALTGFENSREMSPGRINVFDGHPFTTVIDYAHNPEGFQIVAEALQRRYPDRRRIAVVTTLGSRHPEQIAQGAKLIAGLFDRYVCGYDDTYSLKDESLKHRGFPAEEIPQRCADALADAGVPREHILVAGKYPDPLLRGLETARPGEVLTVFTDEPQRTWDLVSAFKPGD